LLLAVTVDAFADFEKPLAVLIEIDVLADQRPCLAATILFGLR
jgi:hypothetical protein